MPATELADGMLIMVGGLLMLTPGFVLDIAGVLCILPFTRPLGRRLLAGVIGRRLAVSPFPTYSGSGSARVAAAGPRTRQRPGDPDDGVVQGEVVDGP